LPFKRRGRKKACGCGEISDAKAATGYPLKSAVRFRGNAIREKEGTRQHKKKAISKGAYGKQAPQQKRIMVECKRVKFGWA